VIKLLAMC